MADSWGGSFGSPSAWGPSFGVDAAPAVATVVEGPNVYQLTGGYPPPLKKPLAVLIPPALAALMKKSDAQVQYERRLARLAVLELL